MTTTDGAPGAGASAHQPGTPWEGYGSPDTPGSAYHQHPPARHQPALGWLFLAPALILVLFQQLVPAVRTVLLSLRDVDILSSGDSVWVGLAHYEGIFSQNPPWTARPGVIFGLAVAVIGFATGFGLGRLGSRVTGAARRIGLAAAGLALVFIAPLSTLMGLNLWVDLRSSGYLSMVVVWLPVAMVIGLMVGMALPPGRGAGRALGFGSVIAAIAGVALGVQSTAGVIAPPQPHSPGSAIYHLSFVTFQLGTGAAMSTVLLGIVVPLGVLATRALLASRLRLRIQPRGDQPARSGAAGDSLAAAAPGGPAAVGPRAGSGAGAVIAGVVVLVIALVASLPWLIAGSWGPLDPAGAVGVRGSGVPGAGAALLRTWLGGGGQVLLAVVVAVLAGAGIGYYRPLGERSVPVLLTVLSPALFVGLLPLITMHYLDRDMLGLRGTVAGGLYPQVVVVPLVFLSAYLCDAWHRAARERPEGSHRALLTTASATLGLAAAVLLIMRAENPTWSMMAFAYDKPDVAILALQDWRVFMIPEALGLLRPLPVILVLAVVMAVCAAGMRRLRLETIEHPAHRQPMPGAPDQPLSPAGGGPHVPGQAWPGPQQ